VTFLNGHLDSGKDISPQKMMSSFQGSNEKEKRRRLKIWKKSQNRERVPSK
jgi:hypothetical protein